MKKKYSYTRFMIIAFFLLTVFLFVFCYFLYRSDDTVSNATILVSYSPNSSLTVDSSMPVTDAVGKQLSFTADQKKYGYMEFSISSNMERVDSVTYEIYLKEVEENSNLPSDYVKVYLTDGKTDLALDGYQGNSVPTYQSLKVANSDPGSKRIYSGILKKDEVKNFKLRVWLKDTYPITTKTRNFEGILYVKVID